MYIKIHRTQESEVVAVCDEDLIGKKFEQDNLQLNISKRFYKGKKITEKDLVLILKNTRNCNLIGKETIRIAIKHKIIDRSNILKIKKIPYSTIVAL